MDGWMCVCFQPKDAWALFTRVVLQSTITIAQEEKKLTLKLQPSAGSNANDREAKRVRVEREEI